ncbi:Lactate utilization protein C [Pseudoclavibacter triregionum]|nr:Lactate utilization protein C [Pseudoclavibacter triregionum]
MSEPTTPETADRAAAAAAAETLDARATVLSRVRYALRDTPRPPEPPRAYRRASTLGRDAVVDLLEERLVDYRATVFRERPDTIAGRLEALLGDTATIVPDGVDPAWLPAGMRIVRDRDAQGAVKRPAELDVVGAVLTSSTVSCAETGTIFLNGGPAEGRRALTLVPDRHVCVVPLETIVELIPEAFARVSHERPITMISGPSATSDIELERVEGVHGPRTLEVILLG